MDANTNSKPVRVPWNKGKMIGQKAALILKIEHQQMSRFWWSEQTGDGLELSTEAHHRLEVR